MAMSNEERQQAVDTMADLNAEIKRLEGQLNSLTSENIELARELAKAAPGKAMKALTRANYAADVLRDAAAFGEILPLRIGYFYEGEFSEFASDSRQYAVINKFEASVKLYIMALRKDEHIPGRDEDDVS